MQPESHELGANRLPTVLLRHDTPDGAYHYDWMIARDHDGPLITLRLDANTVERFPMELDAVELPDHRRRYLDFEGDIGGGRGVVARVGSGEIRGLNEGLGSLRFDVHWDDAWIEVIAARLESAAWRISAAPRSPMPGALANR